MTQTLEAIFEHGVFRPLNRLEVAIPEGQHVKLSFDTSVERADPLALALDVYKGIDKKDLEEIEKIALARKIFFGGKRSANAG